MRRRRASASSTSASSRSSSRAWRTPTSSSPSCREFVPGTNTGEIVPGTNSAVFVPGTNSAKEARLAEDIRLLGRLLGDTIRAFEGDAAFEMIEAIRQLAVGARRLDDVAAHERLA